MSSARELRDVSEAAALAAAEGRWDAVRRELRQRSALLARMCSGVEDRVALEHAFRAGEEVRRAGWRLRAGLETELQNLRAARNAARVWRPYREASGGTLDVSY